MITLLLFIHSEICFLLFILNLEEFELIKIELYDKSYFYFQSNIIAIILTLFSMLIFYFLYPLYKLRNYLK